MGSPPPEPRSATRRDPRLAETRGPTTPETTGGGCPAMLTTCAAFAALPSAARLARCFTAKVLTDFALDGLVDTAQLLASELVTNAVKATGITKERPSWSELRERCSLVSICIYRTPDGRVVLEVWDRDRTPPVRRQTRPDDPYGRGLQLVEKLSKDWRYRWPKTGGKIVWCELGIDDQFTLTVTEL
ncbi:MAG: hypothetical protein GEV03_22285 [Streptosporangiales bacterium]|nr:hypothetical protein [Streptosporangiales bacterium]